ncbi:Flp family type IVb pilin [Streptomyces sp. NPDC019443]|uniref:Flp family type IVb pilin n=1 Tax=Streptomyces sp. NPDC019443 TaxID=3365061 RepID=UPI0037B90050
MNDLMLKSIATYSVYMNSWTDSAATRFQKRYENKDRGQTAVEYLGIIVVVVAIVVALSGTSIGGKIKGAITKKIGELTGGGGGEEE